MIHEEFQYVIILYEHIVISKFWRKLTYKYSLIYVYTTASIFWTPALKEERVIATDDWSLWCMKQPIKTLLLATNHDHCTVNIRY